MKDMNIFCMIALICIAVAIGITVESVANISLKMLTHCMGTDE